MWGLRSLQSVEKNKNRLKSDKITEIRSLEEAIEAMRKPEYHFRLIDPALKLQLEQKSWFRKEKDRTNPHMIDLNNSALDDSDVIQLLLFLGAQELHGIALSNNRIGDQGAIAIGHWLESNTTLEGLGLSNNSIQDEV